MANIGPFVCAGPESRCHSWLSSPERTTPALAAYVKAKPEVCLWIGDNVYADTKDDIEHIRKCYRVLEAKPGFAELKRDSIFLPTWDDHDYGLNDAGGKYPLWGQ